MTPSHVVVTFRNGKVQDRVWFECVTDNICREALEALQFAKVGLFDKFEISEVFHSPCAFDATINEEVAA